MNSKSWHAVGFASLIVAMAQSLCTAVLTISGIRIAIGLSALASASGIFAPARQFHRDSIRIPMLIVATAGAILNLAVLFWIRHLRNRPSAQWRRRELSARERRSEKLQIAMAILTLVLVGLETWTHRMLHPPSPRAELSTQMGPKSLKQLVIARTDAPAGRVENACRELHIKRSSRGSPA